MGRRRGFFRFPGFNIIGIVVGAIGIGMLAVIILPLWVWVIIVASACIIFAIKHFFIR